MVFHARVGGIIDLFNVARLDERTVWQAIAETGVSYEEWSIRKEYEQGEPVLQLYIELKEDMEAQELAHRLHQQLKAVDRFYNEAIEEQETNPVRVTLLPRRAFQNYYEQKQKAGADLAHLKPPHMNASQAVIEDLVGVGREGS